MLAMTEEVCPDKENIFEDINLYAWICARLAEEYKAYLLEQFKLTA
jgi:hypothetical protein